MTTGLSDHVRCFHCGNGLHNWETSDIPWIEHARWYPDCYYVKITKGQEFIAKKQCLYLKHLSKKKKNPAEIFTDVYVDKQHI